jgi:1,2-diacylglycerol 3-beta-galactosyltransferase
VPAPGPDPDPAPAGADPQVVVVCGRNTRLQERLRARPQGPGHVRLLVLGFVDNMHELMGACDAIITKAGPGTIAEALISGLPILLNGNVPCQVRSRTAGLTASRTGWPAG